MIERTNVQIFVYTTKPTLKVLILKRIPEKSGYWQPPCGGVNKGESPIDAARRELFEETGIVHKESIIDLDYSFTYRESKNGVMMDMMDICFAAEVGEITKVELSHEHEEYSWCTETEARQYLKWEHNVKALDKLVDLVKEI
ncbi:NUDIX hydrolase [Oceanirhabdus sp. W0125-5]|uniref:NUDIX hydrolase n=1 Tax=Oceanirhabdus sp. W0125-5 TaxID=2999116 RepID=UPI0022F310D6|nr:NUDIX domain-containing protein [Oceanirhabdus sp. W0125-5]WBW96941.1 NUDIX domain-containing protein [Oceanirhabdus sp. W0125-5]